MTLRRPPDPAYFTRPTWYQGMTRHEAGLARFCEAVDAREEAAREVAAEDEETRVEAPATLFGEAP